MSIKANQITTLVSKNNNFCFDSKNIIKFNLLSKIANEYAKEKLPEYVKEKKQEDFFLPTTGDNLFWCWYIFKNGVEEYKFNQNKHFIIEKNKKIDWIPFLRENKKVFKPLKYKLSNLETNLVNEPNMHFTTLETICFLNSISFVIIKNKMIYKNIQEDCEDNDIIILKYYPEQKKYGIFLNNKENFLEKIEEDLFRVKSIEKPLKSISTYKLKDLQDIAEKLNINLISEITGKKKTKKLLYSDIQEQLV